MSELKQSSAPDPEKLASIRDLVLGEFEGNNPDVIFALGAGIKQTPSGDYRSLAYSDLGEHGTVTGGRLRVIAAAEIAEALPETKVVTSSFNQFDTDAPTMAAVDKQELVQRGVSEDRIDTEENSFSTITQLVELVRMSVDNQWVNVAAITNDYHKPRIATMYERLDSLIDDDEFQGTLQEFKAIGTNIKFVGAEDVVVLMGDQLSDYIAKAKQTPEYAATLASETKGVDDLLAGKYRVKLSP